MFTRKRRTKRRSLKADGETRALDLCPCCYSFHCDPFAMSIPFQNKIRTRLRMGLCPSCGEPVGFCKCRSSMTGTAIVTRNNKKRNKAMALMHAKEEVYRRWHQNLYLFELQLGEELANEVGYALFTHKVPPVPWNTIQSMLQGCRLDPALYRAGWQS